MKLTPTELEEILQTILHQDQVSLAEYEAAVEAIASTHPH